MRTGRHEFSTSFIHIDAQFIIMQIVICIIPSLFKGNSTPQNWACFEHYLKMINIFRTKMHLEANWETQKMVLQVKGVLHLWALFLKTLCIFSKNKATSDKVSYGSGQKCSKELENYSFTSVETIVVKLQWKMCENQYFPCFEP